jgi:hypothetical protein
MRVRFVLPLLLLILELAEIHDSADGRALVRRHFDQIQIGLAGGSQGLFGGHDAQLFPFRGNDADRRDADLFVDPL